MPKDPELGSNCLVRWRNRTLPGGQTPSIPSGYDVANVNWMRVYLAKVDENSFTYANWAFFPEDVFRYFNPDHIPKIAINALQAPNQYFCRFLTVEGFQQMSKRQFEKINSVCFKYLSRAIWQVMSVDLIQQLDPLAIAQFPPYCDDGPFSVMSCAQIQAFSGASISSSIVPREIQACWIQVRL